MIRLSYIFFFNHLFISTNILVLFRISVPNIFANILKWFFRENVKSENVCLSLRIYWFISAIFFLFSRGSIRIFFKQPFLSYINFLHLNLPVFRKVHIQYFRSSANIIKFSSKERRNSNKSFKQQWRTRKRESQNQQRL
jgi:hypothetical protein